ncbi:MAG: 16S rRNA (guanine(527)-N(7))-methyltransferase RsmG [Candidatus Accumulibacter sp.]|uniref:16S rRNA (guanine(527)-N(7))-methyltransferase RsmG n=1 Tax=Accumulibacter sp. TaxID=2053492 RepID=UPI00287849CB|nr:16S rRNA (guanine(527)-N(7))-methyltransferase RsmG [Accumulibacter sp.]MDS4013069.1 16S rRNA (guanine(527)-N(7))-methyltransferase RsmG [Accumulibacter sp.]
MQPAEQLADGLARLGLEPAPGVAAKLLAYLDLLAKWNRTYRLTAVHQVAPAISQHLLDSLAIVPHLVGPTLLDVGSGGGMPGLPLAILRPDLRTLLLDASSKKAAFLKQAAIELDLTNIAVHCGRVEDYRPAAGFTTITARAFSTLAEFVAASHHLLADGGRWLAMKGVRPDAEMAQLAADVRVEAVHRLVVPGIAGERHLVVLASRRAGQGGER